MKLRGQARPSALDGITFAQMRSLLMACTAENFLATHIDVPHLPGLVNRGAFLTYQHGPARHAAWYRMAAVLLKLSWLCAKRLVLGHNAIVGAMQQYSWRPSLEDVAYCLVSADQALRARGDGPLLPGLAEGLRDDKSLCNLAVHAASLKRSGHLAEGEMLRRYRARYASPQSCPLDDGAVLDISKAERLWAALDLSQLCRIKAVPMEDSIEADTGDTEENGSLRAYTQGFELTQMRPEVWEALSCSPKGPVWAYTVGFERAPMRPADWEALKAAAPLVGRLCQTRHRLLKDEEDDQGVLRDWARFSGAVAPRKRLTLDVEDSLEALGCFVANDASFCRVKEAMEALGQGRSTPSPKKPQPTPRPKISPNPKPLFSGLGNVVMPQPSQSQIVLEEDAYCTALNIGLEAFKEWYFSVDEDCLEVDFAASRRKVYDVLRSVTLAVAAGHHEGKLGWVRLAAGLVATADWRLAHDSAAVLRAADCEEASFEAVPCETVSVSEARFCCWKQELGCDRCQRSELEERTLSDASGNEVPLWCGVIEQTARWVQFLFPLEQSAAAYCLGVCQTCRLLPIRPRRWPTFYAAAVKRAGRVVGRPVPDFSPHLFGWRPQRDQEAALELVVWAYRLYKHVSGWLLAPLPLGERNACWVLDRLDFELPCSPPLVNVVQKQAVAMVLLASPMTALEATRVLRRDVRPLPPSSFFSERSALLQSGAKERGEALEAHAGRAWEHAHHPCSRHWCLVDPQLSRFEVLCEAQEGLPPHCPARLSTGPDTRLAHTLTCLCDAPEALFANPIAHPRSQGLSEVPLLSSGAPFLSGNAAVLAKKTAAASILRMPIFGAPQGVLATAGHGLGGPENSLRTLGSAPAPFAAVSEVEARNSRLQGAKEKETTALRNKGITLKASTASLTPDGRVVSAPFFDGYCRAEASRGRLCMGQVSGALVCRSCDLNYAEGGVVEGHRSLCTSKRLLEDGGLLCLSKKMRRLSFPRANHAVLRGSSLLSLQMALRGEDASGSVLTRLPDDHCLCSDAEAAGLYPGIVYFIKDGELQARGAQERLEARSSEWTLPPNCFLLVERFCVLRGREIPPPDSDSEEEREWKIVRNRFLRIECDVKGAEASAAEVAEETLSEADAMCNDEDHRKKNYHRQ